MEPRGKKHDQPPTLIASISKKAESSSNRNRILRPVLWNPPCRSLSNKHIVTKGVQTSRGTDAGIYLSKQEYIWAVNREFKMMYVIAELPKSGWCRSILRVAYFRPGPPALQSCACAVRSKMIGEQERPGEAPDASHNVPLGCTCPEKPAVVGTVRLQKTKKKRSVVHAPSGPPR